MAGTVQAHTPPCMLINPLSTPKPPLAKLALKYRYWLGWIIAWLHWVSGRWMALPDFPDHSKWGFSLVALNNNVYVTGRFCCCCCWCRVGALKEWGQRMVDKDVGTGLWHGARGLLSSPSKALLPPCWVDPATGK